MKSDNEEVFYILNDYINQELINMPNDDELYIIEKINLFVEQKHYEFDIDLLIRLLKENKKFNRLITSIFHKYSDQIISGYAAEIYDNDFFLMIIDTYCILNNIEINPTTEKLDSVIDISDTVDTYLKEIGRYPLLSAEQEKKLAIKAANGDEIAKQYFIECNLKLVVSIAKQYINRGLSFMDLVQEGSIGLMNATERFDVTRGFKFSTFAIYWIRQSISRAIAQKGRNIRLTITEYLNVQKYKRVKTNIENKVNREATITEIAKEMGISINDAINLCKIQNDTISLNMYTNDDDDLELEATIPSDEKPLEDVAITTELQKLIQTLFKKCALDKREIGILLLRYGFTNEGTLTLEEIGQKYNITRERVRQIETNALLKIRRSKFIEKFAIYMDNPQKAINHLQTFKKKIRKSKYSLDIIPTQNKLLTIYDQFPDNTKEDILKAITKLDVEDRSFLVSIYGSNFDIPICFELNWDQKEKYYCDIVPKMKKLLNEIKATKKIKVIKKKK